MATASKSVKDYVFEWEGKDRNGKTVRGELRAVGENQVQASLRRQGIVAQKIKRRSPTAHREAETAKAHRG